MRIAANMALVLTMALPNLTKAWTSALYPSNWTPPVSKDFHTDAFLQDWSYAGYHRGELEPPREGDSRLSSTRVFRVTAAPFLADSTGTKDATASIQMALDSAAAAGAGVVFLPAGTYKLSPSGSNPSALSIRKSRIILRGAGPDRTFLWNTATEMNSKSIVRTTGTGSWLSIPTTRTFLARDLRRPTDVIPLTSTSGFKVGDQVIVRNRITEGWVAEHKETDWSGKTSGLTGIIYLRQILSIDPTAGTITIDAPIRYALLTGDSAMVHAAPSMLEEVGLENLSIGNTQIPTSTGWAEEDYSTAGNAGCDAHNSYAILFQGVRNGWIRNVRSFQPKGNTSGAHILSNGILLNQARGVLVDSCDIGNAQYGGGGGNGYGYRVSGNENMVRDSRSWFTRHGFVLSHMLASGNVFLRIHDKETGLQTGLSGSESTSGSGSDNHMHFSHSNLFDNCTSENSVFLAQYRPYGTAPRHDLTAAHTAYWNTQGIGTGVKGINDVIRTQQARYGYVVGTRGTRTGVSNAASNATSDSILKKTAPLDSLEGIGQGATLSPASLWKDQFTRRTTTPPTRISEGTALKFQVTFRKGILHLQAPQYPADLRIRDAQGRLHRSFRLTESGAIPALARGFYILDTTFGASRIRESLVVTGD
jgi:hypothetical protein